MPLISFPLLRKELLEQANRKRTYALRVIFVMIMGSIFLIAISNASSSTGNIDLWQLRNIGSTIMIVVITCQFIVVLVILPASAATVITVEKERHSLELIMLTKLHPWEIIFQKYFSRIIPAVMFIFLSMPLIAVAYAFGGMNINSLGYLIAELFILIFYIGSLGVLFSAFFRSSITAIIITYISITLSLIMFFTNGIEFRRFFNFEDYIIKWFLIQGVVIAIALPLAIRYLKSRKFVQKGNPLLRIFNSWDLFWKKMNTITGNIEIIKSDNYQLPWINPIRWYEKYKRPSGRLHYLTRIIVLFSLPVVVFFLLGLTFGVYHSGPSGQILMIVLLSIITITKNKTRDWMFFLLHL